MVNFDVQYQGNTLILTASGAWETQNPEMITLAPKRKQADSLLPSAQSLLLRTENLTSWDSTLIACFTHYIRLAEAHTPPIPVDTSTLPRDLTQILTLSLNGKPSAEKPEEVATPFVEAVGEKTVAIGPGVVEALAFVGEFVQSFFRLISGRSAMSRRDFWDSLKECGLNALPIVSLTTLLLGLILAFVGAIQLRMFGADIYIASFVAIAMVRVMAPILTGIVLAGRTGASFAAIIGSMQTNEEVDALTAMGISPMDFLVLPRVLALVIMIPLLSIYADIMGIIGGLLVGVLMLGIAPAAYWDMTINSLTANYIFIGLFHALVFGFIIALSGCYQGLHCDRSAEGVGRATTAAVVDSIVGIIISTSIITLVLTLAGV